MLHCYFPEIAFKKIRLSLYSPKRNEGASYENTGIFELHHHHHHPNFGVIEKSA